MGSHFYNKYLSISLSISISISIYPSTHENNINQLITSNKGLLSINCLFTLSHFYNKYLSISLSISISISIYPSTHENNIYQLITSNKGLLSINCLFTLSTSFEDPETAAMYWRIIFAASVFPAPDWKKKRKGK